MPYRGVHVNALTTQALDTLRRGRPGLVKTLDHGPDWRALKAECGIRFLLGRVWCDDDAALTPTPEAAAERLWARVWAKVARHQGVYDALETPWNEQHQRGVVLADHARACRRFCQLAHDHGFKVAVGCFSVGNPEPNELAHYFAPGLELADYLSVHEYWLPGDFQRPWWAGRWERLWLALPETLRRPIVMSECGVDGGLQGLPARSAGWRAYHLSAAEYVAQLDAYQASLDARVVGTAVFNLGDYDGGQWSAFEVAGVGEFTQWLAAGRSEPAPAPAPETEQPMAELNPNSNTRVVGPGFLDEARRRQTQLVSDEIYLHGATGDVSLAVTTDGVLVYTATGGVRFLPFE